MVRLIPQRLGSTSSRCNYFFWEEEAPSSFLLDITKSTKPNSQWCDAVSWWSPMLDGDLLDSKSHPRNTGLASLLDRLLSGLEYLHTKL
jgi:hypothetical protein